MSTGAPANGVAISDGGGSSGGGGEASDRRITIVPYSGEAQLPAIQALIDRDLSEPYSIFTHRFFLHRWPQLCFLAMEESGRTAADGSRERVCVGAVVGKLDMHANGALRGYIAMLAVLDRCRGGGLGTRLVRATIRAMAKERCDEVVLEAEMTNVGALRLYEQLGFVRDKLLEKYYLNGNGAYRLKLRLQPFQQVYD